MAQGIAREYGCEEWWWYHVTFAWWDGCRVCGVCRACIGLRTPPPATLPGGLSLAVELEVRSGRYCTRNKTGELKAL